MSDRTGYLLSRPVPIHWAGWESNTYRLQQAGWSLSAEQDIRGDSIRLALRHEACRVYGLTARMPWYYMEELRYHDQPPPFDVQHMVGRANIELIERASSVAFAPIDAAPQWVDRRRTCLEDFAHFAPSLARTQEIILPEENVPELLERILKLQQPARTDRLREALRNPEGYPIDAIPRQKFHAQIVSLAA